MWMFNLLLLAVKQILRHPVRSLLTVFGVITGMFLYTSVETMQAGMRHCTETTAKDNVLVVISVTSTPVSWSNETTSQTTPRKASPRQATQ